MSIHSTNARLLIASIAGAALALASVLPAAAGSPRAAPVTKATAIHGAPANTPGFAGDSCAGSEAANPGVNGGCGASDIHNIAGGAPGQSGTSAARGGEPPACTMHGGLGGNNTGTPCND